MTAHGMLTVGLVYHPSSFSVVAKERHRCGAFDATSLQHLVGGIKVSIMTY